MIDQTTLHRLFDFDFEAGKLFWKRRDDLRSQWNGRYAGREAFTALRGGYRHGAINGRLYQAHRVIFAAAHGVWPELVDHINRDITDNQLGNLRAADKALNSYNAKVRADSSTGITGVSWSKRRNAWRAYLTKRGKQVHLGYFSTRRAASDARQRAFAQHMEPRG